MRKILFISVILGTILNAGGNVEPANTPIEPILPQKTILTRSNFYIGGALSALSARKKGVSFNLFKKKAGQDRLGNLTFLAGYNYNKNLAFEARASTTIAKKGFTSFSGFSLFAKPKYEIYNNLNIYALLGLGYVKLSSHHNSGVKVSKSRFQWGLGASYNIDSNYQIFADYTNLGSNVKGKILGEKKANIDSINIGFIYNFK